MLIKKRRGLKVSHYQTSLYYKTRVIKTLWYWNKNREKDDRNKIGSPKINPHFMWTVTYDKGAKSPHRRKESLFNKWAGKTGQSQAEKWNQTSSYTTHKILSQFDPDRSCGGEFRAPLDPCKPKCLLQSTAFLVCNETDGRNMFLHGSWRIDRAEKEVLEQKKRKLRNELIQVLELVPYTKLTIRKSQTLRGNRVYNDDTKHRLCLGVYIITSSGFTLSVMRQLYFMLLGFLPTKTIHLGVQLKYDIYIPTDLIVQILGTQKVQR